VMLADASFAQVKAEPLGVTVGGYMTRTFKVQDRDKVTGSGQTDRAPATFGGPDAEIWFSLRAVLDNGLRIGGRIELEGATDADQIDESYVWFENDLGRIELGSTDRVASKMQYFSPNATLSGQTTGQVSENSAISVPANNRAGGVSMWFANAINDTEGLNIYTSSNRYFGSKAGKGLQLGVSYTPDGCQDYNNSTTPTVGAAGGCDNGFGFTNNTGQQKNNFQVAANYLESFGDVNVALYAGWVSTKPESIAAASATAASTRFERLTGWQAGAQLGYNLGGGSTVTVGGGYKKEEVTSAVERRVWVAGIYYLSNGAAPGSIGVGADYWTAKGEETEAAGGVAFGDDKGKLFQVGVSYQLATGIKLYGGAGTYKFTDGGRNGVNAVANESKANFGLLGVNLVF